MVRPIGLYRIFVPWDLNRWGGSYGLFRFRPRSNSAFTPGLPRGPLHQAAVEDLNVVDSAGEVELQRAHGPCLFLKPVISGQVKPALGRSPAGDAQRYLAPNRQRYRPQPSEVRGPRVRKTEFSDSSTEYIV